MAGNNNFIEEIKKISLNTSATFTWVDINGNQEVQYSWRELWERSGAVADKLVETRLLKPGDRAAICYPFGPHWVVGFLALSRAGCTAVSIYPPNPESLDRDIAKMEKYLENAGDDCRLVLTTKKYKRLVQASALAGKSWPKHLVWKSTDARKPSSKRRYPDATPKPDDIMFIQYTSGSTGDPKGVMISHRAANCMTKGMSAIIAHRHEELGAPVVVTWLPQYHDYGLFTTLSAWMGGINLVMMSPLTFIKKPLLWLQTIETYRGTHINAPNFGYALVAKRVKETGRSYDLSSVRHADMGAEPIRAVTVGEMHTILGIAQEAINGSYGLAETCLGFISGGQGIDKDTGLHPSGKLTYSNIRGLLPDAEVCIANASGQQVPPGETGQIMFRGPMMASGYWRRPEVSKKTFENPLTDVNNQPVSGGTWLATGDLGLIKDDFLYVTGRMKDVIIINGRNIYPTDVEFVADNTFPAIIRPGCSAAFQHGDGAVLVGEFRSGQALDAQQMRQLKQKIEAELSVTIVDLAYYPLKSIPKTTSGKIQRNKAKEMYAAGLLGQPIISTGSSTGKADAGSSNLVVNSMDDLLKKYGAEDPLRTLPENGVDSLRLTQLINEAQQLFRIEIDLADAASLPCGMLATSALTNNDIPCPNIPQPAEYKGSTMPAAASIIVQTFGVLAISVVVAACMIPSAYIRYLLVTATEKEIPHEPWVVSFKGGPGIILPIIVVGWMISYSIAVVILKWLIVGQYKTSAHKLWSVGFAKWWFVDRLVEIWERMVGLYLLDTPFLTLYYNLMGAQISNSARVRNFVREMDLIHIGSNATVSGNIFTRIVDAKGLAMDHVTIEPNAQFGSDEACYPGSIIENKGHRVERDTFLGTLQRLLFPAVAFASFILGTFVSSWATQKIDNAVIRYTCVFFGSQLVVVLLTAIAVHPAFFGKLDYTVDRLSTCANGMLGIWINRTPLNNVMHWLYGGDISLGAQMTYFNNISASKSRYVAVGAGTTLSRSSIRPDGKNGGGIIIGNNVTIGWSATIGAGNILTDGCSIATLASVPSYFSPLPSEHNIKAIAPAAESPASPAKAERSELSFMQPSKPRIGTPISGTFVNQNFVMPSSAEQMRKDQIYPQKGAILIQFILTIVLRCLLTWVPLVFAAIATIRVVKLALQPMQNANWQIWAFVPICGLLSMYISGLIVIAWLIACSHVFVPRTEDISLDLRKVNIRATLYMCYQVIYTEIYVGFISPFVAGTEIKNLIERACGAKIGTGAVTMGQVLDGPMVCMGAGAVSDRTSFVSAHSMEKGTLRFARSEIEKHGSLHPMSCTLAGEVLKSDCVLTLRSKAMFRTEMGRNKSGIWTGSPARECASPQSVVIQHVDKLV